jgi:hypothetical protein
MFLAWYLSVEPPSLTGLDSTRIAAGELARMFNDVHAVVLARGGDTTDDEALYVVGLMAHLTPWLLGPEDEWSERSRVYRARYRHLSPDGISPTRFAGRGAYGDYFAGQASVKDGY